MTLRWILAALGSLAVYQSVPAAQAETRLHVPLQSCTTLNCGALTMGGIAARGGSAYPNVQPFVDFYRNAWVVKVFANASPQHPGCLRVDLLKTLYGDEPTVVRVNAPSGTTSWYSDHRTTSGVHDPRPLVVAKVTEQGWYTVQVARYGTVTFAEDPASNHYFLIAYGRYPLANPNCTTLTKPDVNGG